MNAVQEKIARIDWKMLAKQKFQLVTLLADHKIEPASTGLGSIWGIVHLLDALEDTHQN